MHTPWKFNIDYIDAVLDAKNDGLENASLFKNEDFGYLVVKFRGVVDLCDVVNCGQNNLLNKWRISKSTMRKSRLSSRNLGPKNI